MFPPWLRRKYLNKGCASLGRAARSGEEEPFELGRDQREFVFPCRVMSDMGQGYMGQGNLVLFLENRYWLFFFFFKRASGEEVGVGGQNLKQAACP